jgi:hypothetical protein
MTDTNTTRQFNGLLIHNMPKDDDILDMQFLDDGTRAIVFQMYDNDLDMPYSIISEKWEIDENHLHANDDF